MTGLQRRIENDYTSDGRKLSSMQRAALTTNPDWQPYRFSGKELIKQNVLNMHDFGARLFDVAGLPMWTSMDPLCEKYYHISPYVYCAGDPVNLFDPDGKDWFRKNNSSDYTWFDTNEDIDGYSYIGPTILMEFEEMFDDLLKNFS